jgi:hypothetical protein
MRSVPEQEADFEKLFGVARVVADRILHEIGEFLPYGHVMRLDGEIVSVSAAMGEEHPASKDLISRRPSEGSGRRKALGSRDHRRTPNSYELTDRKWSRSGFKADESLD